MKAIKLGILGVLFLFVTGCQPPSGYADRLVGITLAENVDSERFHVEYFYFSKSSPGLTRNEFEQAIISHAHESYSSWDDIEFIDADDGAKGEVYSAIITNAVVSEAFLQEYHDIETKELGNNEFLQTTEFKDPISFSFDLYGFVFYKDSEVLDFQPGRILTSDTVEQELEEFVKFDAQTPMLDFISSIIRGDSDWKDSHGYFLFNRSGEVVEKEVIRYRKQ